MAYKAIKRIDSHRTTFARSIAVAEGRVQRAVEADAAPSSQESETAKMQTAVGAPTAVNVGLQGLASVSQRLGASSPCPHPHR